MKNIFVTITIFLLTLFGCSTNETTNEPSGEPSESSSNEQITEQEESGEVKVMKVAVATAPDRSLTKGLYEFERIVEEETNGTIDVEVYPDGQLGGDLQVFEGLKMGSIEASTMSTGPIASFAPKLNVLDLPFLFKDTATAHAILDGEIGEELLQELEGTGVIGLNYWENGYRHLTNSVREVKTASDVAGLKIRTLENDLHIDIWEALGAVPTPMAYTELFTALEQRVVDGQENPVGNVISNKMYEVQKYLTKTGHVYNASPFLVSETFWNQLTSEEQEIIRKAAEQAKIYQRELNAEEDATAFDQLIEEGMIIIELTEEDRQTFVEAVQVVYEKYKDDFGKDLVNRLIEAGK